MTHNDAPSFCSHEHWGSVNAIGNADACWGALPQRPAGVADLILDPYFGTFLRDGGWDWKQAAKDAGFEDAFRWAKADPEAFHAALQDILPRHRLTGAYQTLKRGILALYGVDLDQCDAAAWCALDAQVEARYADLFDWYGRIRSQAHFTECIRPVGPEFFFTDTNSPSAHQERAFMTPVMRVDPLLTFWKPECLLREQLAAATGIDPVDAESWRAFIAALFDAAARGGAVGTKQFQGYMRVMDFPDVAEGEVTWRGEIERPGVKTFQDWVMNRCLEETARRGWVHQCHTGAANPATSNPRPLGPVARRYPGMKLVLLHCWPFLAEARELAVHEANVYLDPCWLTVLNPESLRDALREWLGAVPLHKITCGHDATSIEMAVGSAALARLILGEVLDAHASTLGLGADDASNVVHDILHNNAVALYGIGEAIQP